MMTGGDGRRVPVGIERDARELTARVGGVPTRSLAELARQTPVLLLNPDSHRLLEDGPRQRRRFMDWGLFHAEPGFLDAWRRYDVALRHRNATLRAHAADRVVDAWDGELSAAAALLDRLRESFCKALGSVLRPLTGATLGEIAVEVEYRRGWPWSRLNTISHRGCGQGARRIANRVIPGSDRTGPTLSRVSLAGRQPRLCRAASRSCW